ncbi:MAG TPA: NAD-dependent epimerase/dehydratase family protein [Candidatus Limnocylindria bacterium]|nr:NAD-dependent epimerase/dehydratase family protein [Candidatus Limnocylindria bacterium]
MKALVTGATGFAGGWLARELERAGHEVVAAPPSRDLDVADADAVHDLVRSARPDVIAHLAAVASAGAAARDLDAAIRTNVGGTVAVTRAAATLEPPPGLLLVSSAEVYRPPTAMDDAVLAEDAPLTPRTSYGLLKLAQEGVALAGARRDGVPAVIVRPFNHIGPGQRPISAAAAFVERVRSVRRGESDRLRVGNIDVERDIGDVRDVVRAYRLLLEALADGRLGNRPSAFNVATGQPTRLRTVIEVLCRLAGVRPTIEVDPALIRNDDPPRIVGDAGALHAATGWAPEIALETTLADMLAAAEDA